MRDWFEKNPTRSQSSAIIYGDTLQTNKDLEGKILILESRFLVSFTSKAWIISLPVIDQQERKRNRSKSQKTQDEHDWKEEDMRKVPTTSKNVDRLH